MKFTLDLACDNAAFEESPRDEIARILREVADEMENGSQENCGCYDVNGNRVGAWKVS